MQFVQIRVSPLFTLGARLRAFSGYPLLCARIPWSPQGTSVKIGTIQRRLAWSLRKDDTQ